MDLFRYHTDTSEDFNDLRCSGGINFITSLKEIACSPENAIEIVMNQRQLSKIKIGDTILIHH